MTNVQSNSEPQVKKCFNYLKLDWSLRLEHWSFAFLSKRYERIYPARSDIRLGNNLGRREGAEKGIRE